jgi:hypothetical protein
VRPVHPAVVAGQRRIVEVAVVVAHGKLVAHVDERDPAEREDHRIEQDEPAEAQVGRVIDAARTM